MKNKGVFISILFIICLGIFITTNTRRLVSGVLNSPESHSNQTFDSAKNDTLTSSAEQKAEKEKIAAPADTPMAVSAMQAEAPVAPIPEHEVSISSQESAVAISPLTGAGNSADNQAAVIMNAEDYKKKLQDIDSQIKKMKDSGIEPNTDSYKNMAEYEYRMWDNELNSVYQAILTVMQGEEADTLRTEEREWVKERDATAHKAISKYNGGTMESLEYTAALADSTRTRVYALLEGYSGYLDQTVLQSTE